MEHKSHFKIRKKFERKKVFWSRIPLTGIEGFGGEDNFREYGVLLG